MEATFLAIKKAVFTLALMQGGVGLPNKVLHGEAPPIASNSYASEYYFVIQMAPLSHT